jgi:hypothetical protein
MRRMFLPKEPAGVSQLRMAKSTLGTPGARALARARFNIGRHRLMPLTCPSDPTRWAAGIAEIPAPQPMPRTIALGFTARHRPEAPRGFASDPPAMLPFEELPQGWRRPSQRFRRSLRAAVRKRLL